MSRLFKDWGLAVLVGVGVFLLADAFSQKAVSTGPAPAFTLQDGDGGTTSLSEVSGKTAVLNFWATWCGPCKAEIPEFARWVEKHPEVVMLGIAVQSGSLEDIVRKAKLFGITWPVLVGDEAVTSSYGVSVFPTTVVVRPDGTIGAVAQGAIDERGLDRLVANAVD